MIDQADITVIASSLSVLVAGVALFSSFGRNNRDDIESVRKEFSPQFEGIRRELDSKIDGIRKETEGRITASALENKDARHQWANDFGGKLMELANDLRRHKDAAETKVDAEQREKRLTNMVTEVKSQTASVINTTNELRDMLTRVMVKLDVVPNRHGAD